MTTEITRKQAILLAVLGVLLVLVCYVQFLIKPMLKDASGYKEKSRHCRRSMIRWCSRETAMIRT